MDLEIYSISFELTIEAIVNHQKLRESNTVLNEIAKHNNHLFDCELFTTLLATKPKFYNDLLLNEEELLFITDSHIPYLLKTKQILTPNDCISAYILIQHWKNHFNLPNPLIFNKLSNSLGIKVSTAQEIELFFSNIYKLANHPNFISISPQKSEPAEKLEGLWIDQHEPQSNEEIKFKTNFQFSCTANVLFIDETKFFLCGLNLGGISKAGSSKFGATPWHIIKSGDVLNLNNSGDISYAQLKNILVEKHYRNNAILRAKRLSISYSNKRGVKPFNLIGQPGELIGILGKEGTGKSSILKLLAGYIKPKSGQLLLNGHDLHKNPYQLKSLIGYVPEEDLLFPELTVFQNLYFASQLYLSGNDSKQSNIIVEEVLQNTGLITIKDVRVGRHQEKLIQPGQRRLVNIALELLRDPQVLIVDNSTSTLNMSDSAMILEVLNNYTFKGKLIITSICLSGANHFEYFDSLFLLAAEGIPIYFGPRYNALTYLLGLLPKGVARNYLVNDSYSPEILLELISISNGEGGKKGEAEQYIKPIEQYTNYMDQSHTEQEQTVKREKIPGNENHPPRLEKQFIVYFLRNFITKISRKRDLMFSVFAIPLISLTLSLILKHNGGDKYYFSENTNIPSFFYISIIVNIFIGLAQSVREIIRERFVLDKEENLYLSNFSYINSKVSYLLIIGLIQCVLYTIIANTVLGIKDMFIYHTLIYFSCSASGVLLGLLFSSTHNVYDSIVLKSIPLTLIFLIILGGGWIPLNNLNFTKDRYTPVMSDLSISRWAFEAIVVQQYAKNPYEKHFFEVNKTISNKAFDNFHLLPQLKESVEAIKPPTTPAHADSSAVILKALKNKLSDYQSDSVIFPFEFMDSLSLRSFSNKISEEVIEYLNYLEYVLYKQYLNGIQEKSRIGDSLILVHGHDGIENLNRHHVNHQISQMVRNSSTRENLKIVEKNWVRFSDPIYQLPTNNMGRSQLFSSSKKFNNQIIPTFEFNLSIIWLFNFLFYILLITNLVTRIRKVITKP